MALVENGCLYCVGSNTNMTDFFDMSLTCWKFPQMFQILGQKYILLSMHLLLLFMQFAPFVMESSKIQ